MKLEELIQQFRQFKQTKPQDVNELLDFIQRSYIYGELTISQYRQLFKELSERGAEKPIYFSEIGMFNSKLFS
ncbi:YppF family protein [Desertibacillus haloalkaliphilus]|uniref:YppF family protein n=1 Tax=Desertibacillus haloalkaliphilus TaxID=1328930 RepID=UPI001C265990|nr:YppF family protein [Desertibacillus haloalkaliphilus]MBU8907956.1 YppF family protein [Desertibacillus haloalkaliphilus]